MSRRITFLRTLLTVVVCALALGLLASCGASIEPTDVPAAEEPAEEPEQEVTRVVTETVVEEGEQVEVTRIVTEGEVQTVVATEPAPLVTPAATQAPPLATEAAVEEIAEVEWPGQMRLGESDVVRLSLLPTSDGYEVRAEFAEHRTVTETVALEQLAGYDVIAAARLDGVGFNLAPSGEQPQDWQPGRPLTWRWTISPRRSGQQRLSLALTMQWRPEPGRSLPSRQVTAFSRALDVQVAGGPILSSGQMLAMGLAVLVLGLAVAAVVVRRLRPVRPVLQRVQPDTALQLEPHPTVALDEQERSLLQAVFRGYRRAAVETEFQSGYSGARIFLVLPIHADGRADAYTIAKLGVQQSILREFENYETYVEHTLPPVTARIQGRPVTLNGRRGGANHDGTTPLAALRYTFIGAPGQQPRSLRQQLLEGADPTLLETLFRTFGPNWWMQRHPYTFRLATEYDCKLPVHAVLTPDAGGGAVLDARAAPASIDLNPGDLVRLQGFKPGGYRLNGRAVSLVGVAQAGQPPLRLRWLGPVPAEGACGRVVATRESLLQDWTANVDRHGLRDPLPYLGDMLAQTVNGSRSIIHGDLNVENALVGPGDIVWLIDFASTREGHTLFDFAHLGAELAAHVISRQYAHAGAYLEALAAEDEPLLNKLEEIAARCLADTQRPGEYRLALAVSCLGALKHSNLSERAREFLYVTGAYFVERGDWRREIRA